MQNVKDFIMIYTKIRIASIILHFVGVLSFMIASLDYTVYAHKARCICIKYRKEPGIRTDNVFNYLNFKLFRNVPNKIVS